MEADNGDNPPESREAGSGSMVSKTIKSLAFAVLSVLSLSSFAASQGKAKVTFGAWEMMCQPPVGEAATERCGLIQTVRSEDKGASNLGVIIERPPELDTPVLRVVAPLSVYLLNGASLKIDQTDIGRAAFFRCSPAGCLADIPIDGKLLEQLKSGKIATLVIYLDPSEGLRHQVRLEGLKEGYEKIR